LIARGIVSWAPFQWEDQKRASGFTTTVTVGTFFDHTPNAESDAQLNRSLTFGVNAAGDQGAHHPTVLPGGVGTVSLWVYYDAATGLSDNGEANSIYLSKRAGSDLVKDAYLGVIFTVGEKNTKVVGSPNASGISGPAVLADQWNHLVFTDDGKTTRLQINNTDAGLSLPTGGNLWYINIVEGIIQTNGTIQKGVCPETWYIDDIECTSPIPSGIEFIDVPATANSVKIDGVINPDEVAGANQVTWDGSSPERPGVHAQFYGQWALPTKEDLTATVYLQNNGSKLYISIDVTDDVVSLTGRANWWEDDSTELYIDNDNDRSTSVVTQVSLNADQTFGNTDGFADWLGIVSKVKPGSKGWQVEAAVDMAGRGLQQGQTYGFDISINDSDGENEVGFQGAQEWLYASYEAAYNNETYWGNIRILNKPLTTVKQWELF